MSARSWCAALLLLGAADIAAINLAVGPRLLADEPLLAAVEEVAARRPLTAGRGADPGENSAPAQPAEAAAVVAAAPVEAEGEPAPAARPAGAAVAAAAVAPTPEAAPVEPTPEPTRAEPAPEAARAEPVPAEPAAVVEARAAPNADSGAGSGSVIIYFATDRATLWPAAQQRLDEVAASLVSHPDWGLSISGHADARGTDDHNTQLSERRVRRVREYLAARGVDGDRVVGRAFGERQPAAVDGDAVALHRNRRVEIQFTRSLP